MAASGFIEGEVRVTDHRGGDDLLSAGLGLAGLAGPTLPFANPLRPGAAELRRRAIQSSWKGIADLGLLGGYGRVYGAVPAVPGREYHAFARLPGARAPHRVLAQVPDGFDRARPCLVVAPASGSRGVYGAIALAGAWALPRGCAVAYTDKGAGPGYFDGADDSGVALDGRRARRGEAPLEFEPAQAGGGIAVKHAHSGDHPEADWGRHVLQAARFGLAMLDRAFPELAPFTARNTRIIAAGLSNGGGAVLQAAGLDEERLLAGVVALEPSIHVAGHGRPLYDYASEAALWLPAALTLPRFAAVPFARGLNGLPPPAWLVRGASLQALGRTGFAGTPAAQACERLLAGGWDEASLAVAAASTGFDLWRALAAGYASAYLRRGPGDMPGGFRYAAVGPGGLPGLADPATRAAWWADASGIPPGDGVGLYGGMDMSLDPTLPGTLALRELWEGGGADGGRLREAVAATAAKPPRRELPLWVVHGAEDGLIPAAFSSRPYVDWLRGLGRRPLYWKIPHAQHFDALLAVPGFGDRHVPLLPYGYAALDRLWEHLFRDAPWPDELPVPAARPRGPGPLERQRLGL
jgi:hydroxybutyrate-dimer hydrolase